MTDETEKTSTSRVRTRTPSSPHASSPAVRRRMQSTPRRDTPCELALRSAVHRLGLRYRVDWPLPGTRRRADLAFVKARVAIFVDGCFWHGCPVHGSWPKANADFWRRKIQTNQERDSDTDRCLVEAGWRVIRFWEHQDMDAAARKVLAALLEVARTRPLV
ncbi:MAG: very short patch repair endonuclease [Acidobacteria bacterium]|nr:MAG: very short patch repair endonuclease [Acidobacteriota bacterium]